jgi:hypothetical protein
VERLGWEVTFLLTFRGGGALGNTGRGDNKSVPNLSVRSQTFSRKGAVGKAGSGNYHHNYFPSSQGRGERWSTLGWEMIFPFFNIRGRAMRWVTLGWEGGFFIMYLGQPWAGE